MFCTASALFFASCMSSPALVGAALPFIISSDEKKLAKNPDDAVRRLETGSYYVMYANAFVEGPARMLPPEDYEKRDRELLRAKENYLKGALIIGEGLEKKFTGFSSAFDSGKIERYIKNFSKDDVPSLYWFVAGTLAAYSIDPLDLDLGFKLPMLNQLITRAYALDPDFNNGALDDFFILFYGSLPPALGGDKAKAKKHFAFALEKTGGNAASPFVSYVESIVVPEQDFKTFNEYLQRALNVDFSKMKTDEEKLANKIAQKKARFFLDNSERYIPQF